MAGARQSSSCCAVVYFHDQLWAARHARLLPHADVAGERLGPRRFRPRACDPEHPLGSWPTVCRRDRRSIRHDACAVCRRRIVRDGSHPDGLLDFSWDARPHRRRLDRLRPLRLFVLRRARGIRQAIARALALSRVRRGHRRRFVRPVPLFPRGGLADGCLRLADRAPRLRRGHAAGAAAVACARDGTGRDERVGGCRVAIAPAGALGGNESPVLCAAGARVLHLWLPTRIHHRSYAGSTAAFRPKSAVGPSR